ncbi:hypothetical protein H206_00870 [Candidatus Electrothrix aarhusensis]|uniref:Uncharacterized protein n=1 Tax=Candidatus Electrothrix aarhusensis TaxID=1859131 RepID=A0A444J018_9BACT|nr:hypothetical protein H206_00870 [Candidatus Electrothrix aarhusensis]
MKKNNRITNSSSKKQSKQTVRVKSSVKAGKDVFIPFHKAVQEGRI